MGKKVLFLVVLVLGVFGFAQTASAQVEPPTPLERVTLSGSFTEEDADVLRLYYAFFDRVPDPSGANYWLDQVDNGLTIDDVAFSFSQGVEFDRNYSGTNDTQFIQRVYQNVLGRTAELSGLTYWTGQLNTGALDRAGVVRFIAADIEFERRRLLPSLETLSKFLPTPSDIAGGQSLLGEFSIGHRERDFIVCDSPIPTVTLLGTWEQSITTDSGGRGFAVGNLGSAAEAERFLQRSIDEAACNDTTGHEWSLESGVLHEYSNSFNSVSASTSYRLGNLVVLETRR